jgi:hypothetical protein
MGSVLHGSARTTPRIRAELRNMERALEPSISRAIRLIWQPPE